MHDVSNNSEVSSFSNSPFTVAAKSTYYCVGPGFGIPKLDRWHLRLIALGNLWLGSSLGIGRFQWFDDEIAFVVVISYSCRVLRDEITTRVSNTTFTSSICVSLCDEKCILDRNNLSNIERYCSCWGNLLNKGICHNSLSEICQPFSNAFASLALSIPSSWEGVVGGHLDSVTCLNQKS